MIEHTRHIEKRAIPRNRGLLWKATLRGCQRAGRVRHRMRSRAPYPAILVASDVWVRHPGAHKL